MNITNTGSSASFLNKSNESLNSKINQGQTSNSAEGNSPSNVNEDVFQIAVKAEKLLQEILSANKSNKNNVNQINIKQEPGVPPVNFTPTQQSPQSSFLLSNNNSYFTNLINDPNNNPSLQYQKIISPLQLTSPNGNLNYPSQLNPLVPPNQYIFAAAGTSAGQVGVRPMHPNQHCLPPNPQQMLIDPAYFVNHPPPMTQQVPINKIPIGTPLNQPQFYYQPQQAFHGQPFNQFVKVQYQLPPNSHLFHQQPPHNSYLTQPYDPSSINAVQNQFNRKRKFGELNNYNNNNNYNRFKPGNSYNSNNSYSSSSSNGITNGSGANSFKPAGNNKNDDLQNPSENSNVDNGDIGNSLVGGEEEDLNIMRERELNDLKCKSVVEKMNVFRKYYHQFKEAYIQRVHQIECSDSLKIQFHSLIKYLHEYDSLLGELDMMITEHERSQCKNNHRKTKKFFNKTKAFIRYDCNKRLQQNIFEYRRLINSQDRYAGMYDLLDMNSYLISLLPDIGISIRRYINRCEKAREQEQLEEEDDYTAAWHSAENSNDSTNNSSTAINDASDTTIPSFKEFVAKHGGNDNDNDFNEAINGEKENHNKNKDSTNSDLINESTSISDKKESRNYESFSKGIDSLNRYLLKRVEEEESLDELVKERIIKWINKRQSKYILIFSEVDKLLNQHKAGECYPKFHSYLLFNLGKLVTVCDSYHQKLKELLYSTTIRRKKKRKKVKLLPEAMADVFDEINDLKRALEYAKISIKRCNEYKSANLVKLVV